MAEIANSQDFTLSLADKVKVGVGLTVGDRTEVGGHEIVPVAAVIYGFGGGYGDGSAATFANNASSGTGAGGGGGSWTVPLGAYIARNGKASFEPNVIALMVAAIPLAAIWAGAIKAVAKAVSKR